MTQEGDKNSKNTENQNYSEEVKYFSVQVEQMNESMKFVAELAVKTVEGLNDLKTEVKGLSAKVDVMDARLTRVETDVKEIKTDLKSKVDRTEFNTLVGRVDKIEA